MSMMSPALQRKRIVLAHGGGGQLTDDLVAELITPRLSNPFLDPLDDAARLPMHGGQLVFTTDSYVVQPLRFPGGDIGRLAISGTVNDLAVSGAVPQFISLGLIIEEGLELSMLEAVLDSIAATAREAGVQVVTGDTKVVGKGHIRPGDVLLVSGTIAEHGLAVMLQREQADSIRSELASDVAPLAGLIDDLIAEAGPGLVFMRDPTRGGLAGVAADLAEKSGLHLTIDENSIPLRPATRYAAEILGLDPLSVANEGKVMAVVRPEAMSDALQALRNNPLGREAAAIGRFDDSKDGLCEIVTDVGGRRVIQKPYGEELPRIC